MVYLLKKNTCGFTVFLVLISIKRITKRKHLSVGIDNKTFAVRKDTTFFFFLPPQQGLRAFNTVGLPTSQNRELLNLEN